MYVVLFKSTKTLKYDNDKKIFFPKILFANDLKYFYLFINRNTIEGRKYSTYNID